MFWRRPSSIKLGFQYARRQFSSGHHDAHHHSHEPHISKGHTQVGKALLVGTYLWVLFKLKQDNGQLFGLYRPWLHEHEHEHEINFVGGETESDMPLLSEGEHHEEEH